MIGEAYLRDMESELNNVAHLFGQEYPEMDCAWTAAEENGAYVCRLRLGKTALENRCAVPQDDDDRIRELHRKRALRRLVKQTLYDACRKETGIHPPWGSLCGVRPTHLLYEALDEGMDMDAAEQAVQDRFDVTPEKARLLREIVTVQKQLPAPGDEWMDVYIGIPFCTTRCTYCSFSSGEIGKGKQVEPYLNALFYEMAEGEKLLRESGKKLRCVYVGGGTPTSLNEADFARLMEKMIAHFPGAAEYTVEAGRPDTITREKLKAIRAAGVGRISINPQTMSDRTLQIIGRAHTAADVVAAYELARQENIHHINMDVIAGLPGETLDDFAATMDWAKQLSPESLTVHTLAIKRSSRLHLENAPLPGGDIAESMVALGLETAKALHMKPYYLYRQKYMAGNQENVGYAIDGHACLYNVDIMEETSHILALGAGGISKRIYPEEGHIGRAPNVSNIPQYIDRVAEMAARKRALFLDNNGAGGV